VRWTEVNITPAGTGRDHFLAGVIAPYIKGHPRLKSWHFFWEPAEGWKPGKGIDDSKAVLRFRILSGDPADRKALLSSLRKAKDKGIVRKWYEGAHGERGKRYGGEAQNYGDRAWKATRDCWHAMSALTLQLAVHASEGDLELPRSYHWKRIAHLSANQMGLPDVRMSLEQGHRYLQVKRTMLDEKLSGPDREVMNALDKYLYQEDVI
jgi:hypothetical protein